MNERETDGGRARVTVFAPNLAITVTLELEGSERERVHFHSAGQGVWVARTVAQVGAMPVLCGLNGGEPGADARGPARPSGRRVPPRAGRLGERLLRHRPARRESAGCSRAR